MNQKNINDGPRSNYVVCVFVYSFPVVTQTVKKEEVLNFERFISEAITKKDTLFLNQAISDDFTFIHSTGATENKVYAYLHVDNEKIWVAKKVN